MRPRPIRSALAFCLGALLCALLPGTAPAQRSLGTLPTDPDSGITIEVVSLFDSPPPSGYLPLRIKVTNGSRRPGLWTVVLTERDHPSTFQSTERFAVDARQSREIDLFLPIAPHEDAYRYLQGSVTGPGLIGSGSFVGNTQPLFGENGWGPAHGYVLLSRKLANAHRDTINAALKQQAEAAKGKGGHLLRSVSGSAFDPAAFPTDVRALRGVTTVCASPEDLGALSPAQDAALSDWIAAGGRLLIAAHGTAPASPPALARKTVGRFGLGNIELTREPPTAALLTETPQGETQLRTASKPHHDEGTILELEWFAESITRPKIRPGLITALVLLFAAVIGPLNLFVLAPRARRHLLFITTPLLALAATTIGLGAIFLHDGTGGRGNRAALLFPLPSGDRVLTLQSQTVRTGMLTSTRFATDPMAWMIPLSHSGSPFADTRRAGQFKTDGAQRSGDWFASRSRKAHLLDAIGPSRAGLHHLPAGGGRARPSVISSFGGPMEQLFLRDEQGKWWRAENVGTGIESQLQPVEERAATDAIHDVRKASGPRIDAALTRWLEASAGSARYVAWGPGGPDDFLQTLRAIRFRDRAIYMGEPTR